MSRGSAELKLRTRGPVLDGDIDAPTGIDVERGPHRVLGARVVNDREAPNVLVGEPSVVVEIAAEHVLVEQKDLFRRCRRQRREVVVQVETDVFGELEVERRGRRRPVTVSGQEGSIVAPAQISAPDAQEQAKRVQPGRLGKPIAQLEIA